MLSACATQAPIVPSGPPGPISQHDREEFYDLRGATADDLHAQIRRWGAANGDLDMAALTRAEFKSNLKYRQEAPGNCPMNEARIDVEIVTSLPRWHPPAEASDDLRRRWQDFDRAIRLHEHGHHEFAEQEAKELSAALQALKVERCEDMNAAAQKANDRIAKKYQDLNDDYDKKTGHGKTQGAVL